MSEATSVTPHECDGPCATVCQEDPDNLYNARCAGPNHLGCGGCCACLGCAHRECPTVVPDSCENAFKGPFHRPDLRLLCSHIGGLCGTHRAWKDTGEPVRHVDDETTERGSADA